MSHIHYIDFLNKKKNFQEDRKEFHGKTFQEANEKARRWGKRNLSNFHEDLIKIKQ